MGFASLFRACVEVPAFDGMLLLFSFSALYLPLETKGCGTQKSRVCAHDMQLGHLLVGMALLRLGSSEHCVKKAVLYDTCQ